MHDISNDLSLFMSLARNKQDVARPQPVHGLGYGGLAVWNLLRVRRARQHVVTDGLGVFAARVVIRHQNDIGPLRGFLRHERAFALVAVTPCAEQNEKLSLYVRTDAVQRARKGVRCVGVIDINRRSIREHGCPLHPATHAAQLWQKFECRSHICCIRPGEGRSEQGVVDLKTPRKGEHHIDFLFPELQPQSLAFRERLLGKKPDRATFAADKPQFQPPTTLNVTQLSLLHI